MKLSLVTAWLGAADIGLRHVGGVRQLADLAATQAPMPAAFVIPAEEQVRSVTEGAGLIDLEATFNFDVVTMVTSSQVRGRDEDQLSDLADLVIARLLGWTPDPIYRPVVPVAGRLLGLGGGRASWITRFRTVFHYRKQGT